MNQPQPFQAALESLLNKQPNGSPLSSQDWRSEHVSIRERSFFSANVENTRFLQRSRDLIEDYLTRATEQVINPTTGEVETILKVGSRADFVRRIREFQIKEGMAEESDFRGDQNDLQDIRKTLRLKLIFDTQTRQAFGYGRWKQSMSPAILDAFPAARFIRHPGAETERERHSDHEDEVRLKTDSAWWADFQNDPEIGGFGVSYPPYGYNSYMDQEPVNRQESERLGLIGKGEPARKVFGESLNERLKASLSGLDDDLKRKLREKLRGRATANKNEIKINP